MVTSWALASTCWHPPIMEPRPSGVPEIPEHHIGAGFCPPGHRHPADRRMTHRSTERGTFREQARRPDRRGALTRDARRTRPRLRGPPRRRCRPRSPAPALADVDAVLSAPRPRWTPRPSPRPGLQGRRPRRGGSRQRRRRPATKAGVMVVNAPTSNIVSAAELAVGLLLACARNVAPANDALKNGEWKRSQVHRGRAATRRSSASSASAASASSSRSASAASASRSSPTTPTCRPARRPAGRRAWSPSTSCSPRATSSPSTCPRPRRRSGSSARGAHQVKPSVRIINAARGGILDEKALAAAITRGPRRRRRHRRLRQRAVTDSPLFELEQVVVTPHLGASTHEAQEKAGIRSRAA